MNDRVKHHSAELLTVAEAEAMTKRKVATWRRDIRLRKIPYVKIGRQVRIPREYVVGMIAQGWRDPIAEMQEQ